MRRLLLLGVALLGGFAVSDNTEWTRKHEKGRCAIRGQCGRKSFFGGELPCPDNGPAHDPDDDLRKKLVGICGEKWNEGAICCDDAQVSDSKADHAQND